MKTLILIVLLLPEAMYSQNEPVEKMNIVKTNVTGYVRNVNLTYERVLNQRFSVSVGFGTVAKGGIRFSSSFIDSTEFSDVECRSLILRLNRGFILVRVTDADSISHRTTAILLLMCNRLRWMSIIPAILCK